MMYRGIPVVSGHGFGQSIVTKRPDHSHRRHLVISMSNKMIVMFFDPSKRNTNSYLGWVQRQNSCVFEQRSGLAGPILIIIIITIIISEKQPNGKYLCNGLGKVTADHVSRDLV